jgi:NAD(P)-dependent dehydrogenase (short-subunit alcohol dehydrogenase family)
MMNDDRAASAATEARDFEGKIVLVLGASRGIGAATARAFARRGAHVVLASRSVDQLEELARSIREAGGTATVQRADLGDWGSLTALGAALRERFGHLDAAFNNAGDGMMPAPLTELDPEAFERVVRVTVAGTFRAMREEIPLILAAGRGAIVNMSSTAGSSAFAGGAAYVAAKHAVIGLTKAAALDFGEKGVRVNAVAPGPIDTDRLKAAPEQYRELTRRAVPMRRIGNPEDVAEPVVWLCSDAARFVTGATLFVDGGRMAGFA